MKTIILSIGLAMTATCAFAQDAPAFRLEGGDPDRGKEAFTQLGCVQCHTVQGQRLERPDSARLNLALASEERFVRDYQTLVTAITNPDHVVQERYRNILGVGDVQPFMPDFREKMTVTQLIDLVTWLDEVYSASTVPYE